MERFSGRRFAALLPAFLLAASLVLPAAAAAVPPAQSVPFAEVTPPEDAAAPPPYHQLTGNEPQAMSDAISDGPLQALIVLEKPSLLERDYDAADLTDNADAKICNEELKQYQADVIADIEAAIGEPLDIVWRLTIIADLLSVRIQPAQMEIIAAVPGVRSVQEDAVVVPMEDEGSEEAGQGGPGDEAVVTGEAGTEEVHGEGPDGEEPGSEEAAGGAPADITAGDIPAVIAESDVPTAIAEVGVTPDYTGAGQRIAIIDTALAAAAADMTGGEARMAEFSSWGVPSSLELKPEITAPGNEIDSLNGAHGSDPAGENARHDNYEKLSGTSMAAPQIAGMAALVTEHLKTRYPALAGDGSAAERRHIAQSLLMSTAVPMKDPDDPDRYYPVLQQGAGLADAEKAVTANAYITMDANAVFRPRSAADGKV